jgi:preprotein translocase subunit SecE
MKNKKAINSTLIWVLIAVILMVLVFYIAFNQFGSFNEAIGN